MKLYNAHEKVRSLVDGPDVNGMIESLGTVFELLGQWLSKASSDGSAREELIKAKNSGKLSKLIGELETKIEVL